jgi:hypothetical protein
VKVLFESGIKKKENIDVSTFNFIDIFLSTSAQVGLNGCSLLIPKKAFEICGSFDPNLPLTQDYDLWFRLKDRYRFILLDKNLVISRRHSEQDSVKKNTQLLEAGDNLHNNFLSTISYERFEEYFNNSKRNIMYAYDNYRVYRLRGYKKTSSKILMNILRYYYENDKNKFYAVFSTELETAINIRHSEKLIITKLTVSDRSRIDLEYRVLLSSEMSTLPIRESLKRNETSYRQSRAPKLLKRLQESIKRDGIYLTGEKMVRKLYKKVNRHSS